MSPMIIVVSCTSMQWVNDKVLDVPPKICSNAFRAIKFRIVHRAEYYHVPSVLPRDFVFHHHTDSTYKDQSMSNHIQFDDLRCYKYLEHAS
jgi:hypothetical protein